MLDRSHEGGGLRQTVQRDALASIVVFLVALPLCLGIALASGVPPGAGLITGIIGGLVVGVLAGSPLQVSGPAAGLTVLVWELVQKYGLEALGPVVLLAGILQLIAGICRLGQWFRAVSPAVILGMLSGIGVLIVASQFHVMVDDAPKGNGLTNLVSIPEAVWKGVVPNISTSHAEAALLGLLTIAVLIAWKVIASGRLHVIPAPLAAIILATIMAEAFSMPVQRVAMPESLLAAVHTPFHDLFQRLGNWHIVFAGASVAFVASAETLLCAAAVDQLHHGPRTRFDRELAAQGVGNMLCGLAGALPMTGVIVRSAANVEAGARTRLSAILHGFWLLVCALQFPWLLERIPTASLAGVLVYTGCKLVNPGAIRGLLPYGRGEVFIYIVTVAVIVAADLLTGVLVGMGLSMAKLLYTCSRLSVRVECEPESRRAELILRGAATFLRLPKLARALEQVPATAEVHLHYGSLIYIDHACLDLLHNWERQHTARGGKLIVDWELLYGRFHRPYRVPNPNAARQPPGNGQSDSASWWTMDALSSKR